jgi:hypothetical protein
MLFCLLFSKLFCVPNQLDTQATRSSLDKIMIDVKMKQLTLLPVLLTILIAILYDVIISLSLQ